MASVGTVIAILLGLSALVAGGLAWGWLRGPLVVGLAVATLVFGAITLLLLVGGFGLDDRGGGVLLLFVIPAGLATVLAGLALATIWGSLPRAGIRPDEVERDGRNALAQWQADLEADLREREARLETAWMMPAKRRALEAELRRRRELYAELAGAQRRGDATPTAGAHSSANSSAERGSKSS